MSNNADRDYKFEYDLKKIFEKATSGFRGRISGKRRMHLSDKAIKALPFAPPGQTVDITHDAFDSKEHGGRLILRIRATSKVFYITPARRGNKQAGTWIKVGTWIVKKSNSYKSDEANLAMALERFPKIIKNYFDEAAVAAKEGEMTIREYLESGQYALDREKTPLKSGKIKDVKQKIVNSILTQFEPWLDCALNEVSEEWPPLFKKHWEHRYDEYNRKARLKDPVNYKEKKVIPSTQRYYYVCIQSMFNICERKGYINKNKIEGFSSLFPDKKKKRGTTETYDFEYSDLFNFIYEIKSDSEKDVEKSNPVPDSETDVKKSNKVGGTENGKLFICIMAVTGCRNAEIYKNLKSNFILKKDDKGNDYFSLFVPAWICKTGEAGEGHVPIRHKFVIDKIKDHLKRNEVVNSRFMFPSPTLRDKHCSDDSYRKTWQSIKKQYGLNSKARLYSLRATIGTRVAEAKGIDAAANLLRDDIKTAHENYNNVSEERLNSALDIVLGRSDEKNITVQTHDTNTEKPAVTPSIQDMPDSVATLYKLFEGGLVRPNDSQIHKEDWDKFVSKISHQYDKGKLKDAEDWIFMNT